MKYFSLRPRYLDRYDLVLALYQEVSQVLERLRALGKRIEGAAAGGDQGVGPAKRFVNPKQ
jgi:hypothetical protein